jgi:tRNA dimethylallyltransferase
MQVAILLAEMIINAMKKIIVVAGPTASGKTDVAIALAKHFHTKIISADSRQCYQELNIGVAKPSAEQLAQVHHYFINSHSMHAALNVADYEQLALSYLQEILTTNDTAIVVGGTGLYIDALCNGIDPMPAIDPVINETVNAQYKQQGIAWLQACIATEDKLFAEKGEMQNPARLIRALVFVRSTGTSILAYRTKQKVKRDFEIVKYAIEMPREIVYDRINRRVDIMMQEGLLAEVTALLPYQHLKNLATVGYREIFDYLNGKCTLEKAVDLIKQNSRNYAKRQVTWFKKDEQMQWMSAEEILADATNS